MSHIVRYIDARATLTKPGPSRPLPTSERFHQEMMGWAVVLGVLVTAIVLAIAWGH